ncbi:WhiB family transcriptional regulator [Nonomuraea sp. NPDC050547]|uniref:WhiB family transcriptional regulator n=1 Tax=Nonomuraea sp. NPDC050547 TaxID=3364368 RepID=UPI0037BD292D
MSWMDRAACRDVDPEIFFPLSAPDTEAGQAAEVKAKGVCGGCRVREECLGRAFRLSAVHGVWGGLGERERRKGGSAVQESAS